MNNQNFFDLLNIYKKLKKKIEKSFQQLESLTNILQERKDALEQAQQDILQAQENLAKLEEKIKRFEEKYNSYKDFEDIEKQREMLIQEKNQLEEFLSTTFNPADILFVSYFNFGNLVVNAFHFYKDDQDCNDDAIKLYKSINDNKLIGFSANFENIISSDADDDEDVINAEAKEYLTFAEVCIKLNKNLHLKKHVTAIEINEVLQEFLSLYQFNVDRKDNVKLVRKVKATPSKK